MIWLYIILSFLFGLYCGSRVFRNWFNNLVKLLVLKIYHLCNKPAPPQQEVIHKVKSPSQIKKRDNNNIDYANSIEWDRVPLSIMIAKITEKDKDAIRNNNR